MCVRGSSVLSEFNLVIYCYQPNLPTCVRCLVCKKENTEDHPLMECRFCGEIVHPSCLEDSGAPCKIITEINNCWECPKCCKDGTVSRYPNCAMSDKIVETL